MKDPYILNLSNLKESFIETELEKAMIERIKTESDNPTIGIILCREKTKFSVEYSLRDINKPIGVSSYEISKVLPKDILEVLPTEEDLNLHIDIMEEENE